MSKELKSLGDLADLSSEEFTDFLLDKNIGYLHSLLNLFIQSYNEMIRISDLLTEKIAKMEPDSPERLEHLNVLGGIYSNMFKIEDKSRICRVMIAERSKIDSDK